MSTGKSFDIRLTAKLFAAIIGIYIALRYASECTQGIKNGILFCIEVAVPSLFLFMALSSCIVRSGVSEFLAKPFGRFTRRLFRLPPESFSVILMSLIGGYPVGARCAAALYGGGRLSQEEARKTACIAVGAGPGFLLNYVGAALLNSRKAGCLLFAAQVIGVLLTGVIVGRLMPAESAVKRPENPRETGGNLLISSVADASRATFQLCGMVILCAALIEVADTVLPSGPAADLTAAVIEITTGCQRMCGRYPLPLIAFFIGFGGISVHLQIAAGLGDVGVNKGFFFLIRVLQGIITALAAYIFLMAFPVEQSVFNSTAAVLTASKSATLAGSAALVFSSLCFLGSIRREKTSNRSLANKSQALK